MDTGGETQESRFNYELPSVLPYEFLKKITDDFSYEREISRGPFGTLYKGIWPHDGRVISVNRLSEYGLMPPDEQFQKEVNVMELRHENISQPVSFCKQRRLLVQADNRYIELTESLLCYHYFPNGSLHEQIFETRSTEHIMDWDTRFKIVKGICQGIMFLHKLDRPIIHMDLKTENIWLGENMVPKIGNFALSRILSHGQTGLCDRTVVGSFGYMPPEYAYKGECSAKSDIYCLGIMIMEIATSTKNHMADKLPSARNYIDIISEEWTSYHIASKYSSLSVRCLQQVRKCIDIGLKCAEIDPSCRPSIVEIVNVLNTIR